MIKDTMLAVGILLTAISVLPNTFTLVHASELDLNVRGGLGHLRSEGTAFYSLAFDEYWSKHGFKRLEVGGWSPNNQGQASAFYGGGGVGVREGSADAFNMQVYLGILAVSRGDTLLSAPFNFTQEFSVGYERLSVGIKHISNAGIATPNVGRDFFFLNYRIDF
jgi:hypothetical protein